MLWAAVAGAGIKPGDVWLQRDQEPAAGLAERFYHAVERRASGVPFAYAVGRTGFRTLDLKLDARALIPRPETEGLVELVLRGAGPGPRVPDTVASPPILGRGAAASRWRWPSRARSSASSPWSAPRRRPPWRARTSRSCSRPYRLRCARGTCSLRSRVSGVVPSSPTRRT